MRTGALLARARRRQRPLDQGVALTAPAANVLDRQFPASVANQKWVADFAYLWTAEGWLYVAVVLDLFSRRVVGWSMQATMTGQFVADALLMAVWCRERPQAILHHSDRGSQAEFNRSLQHCWFSRIVTGRSILRQGSASQTSSGGVC